MIEKIVKQAQKKSTQEETQQCRINDLWNKIPTTKNQCYLKNHQNYNQEIDKYCYQYNTISGTCKLKNKYGEK